MRTRTHAHTNTDTHETHFSSFAQIIVSSHPLLLFSQLAYAHAGRGSQERPSPYTTLSPYAQVSKVTYIRGKRDLVYGQKRPGIIGTPQGLLGRSQGTVSHRCVKICLPSIPYKIILVYIQMCVPGACWGDHRGRFQISA